MRPRWYEFINRHMGWSIFGFCLVGGYAWGLIEAVLLWDEPLRKGWTLALMILVPKGAAVAFMVVAIVLSTYDSMSSMSSRSSSEGKRR